MTEIVTSFVTSGLMAKMTGRKVAQTGPISYPVQTQAIEQYFKGHGLDYRQHAPDLMAIYSRTKGDCSNLVESLKDYAQQHSLKKSAKVQKALYNKSISDSVI